LSHNFKKQILPENFTSSSSRSFGFSIAPFNPAKLILIILVVTSLVFFAPTPYIFKNAEARCPNGYHKSPSGDCEKFIPHTGLPSCPNGYHRSPDGDCEQVSNNDVGARTTITHDNSNDNNKPSSSMGSSQSSSTTTPMTATANDCDQSLWGHVYNPSRLQIIDSCKSVTGIIDSIRSEADGDFHIRLKLDSQFSNLINSANIKGQHGEIVVEPICINPVTQADAISSCQNFRQNISIPRVGTHVEVTGSYVLDKEHGGWAEIHPVTSIRKQ
jgi:hypothetical protein